MKKIVIIILLLFDMIYILNFVILFKIDIIDSKQIEHLKFKTMENLF